MHKNINYHRVIHLIIFIVMFFMLLTFSDKYNSSFGEQLYGGIKLSLGMMILFYVIRLIFDFRPGEKNIKLRYILTYLFTFIFVIAVIFIAPASNAYFLACLSFYFTFVTLLVNSFDTIPNNNNDVV